MSDYISREAAYESLLNGMVMTGYQSRALDCISEFSIPAADVRPVVRGRWVGNKRHQSCSECHMTYCVPDGQDGELDMTAYHFCPNCGTDMRPTSMSGTNGEES